MRSSFRSTALVVASAMSAAPASAQPSLRALEPLPGHDKSRAYAVSADGLFVVGESYRRVISATRAVRWSAEGGIEELGELPGGQDYARAGSASAHGETVVGLSSSANSDQNREAFRWRDGAMAALGDFPGGSFWSSAEGVSADGSVIVGYGAQDKFMAFRKVGDGPLVGLGLLQGGKFSNGYGVSADGSVVVGYGGSPQGSQAFRWTGGGGMIGLGELPGGPWFSIANGVSADGAVVVGDSVSASGAEAFRWTSAGGMVGLGDLPGGVFGSSASAASADGSVIVGTASTVDGDTGFIWDTQHGMRDLRQVLIDLGVHGLDWWRLTSASGISADGRTVVGDGTNPDGATRGWIATLGRPGTPQTGLVSLSFDQRQGDGGSAMGSVSNDGTVVAFWSAATDLVPADTNGRADIFVRNQAAQWTSLASVSSSGVRGNGDSFNPRISGNDRYVVFASDASNLVANDTNGRRDIFLHDRAAKTTIRVSLSTAGVQANGASDLPQISADGRFVVFQCEASNLVAGDTNGVGDIFLWDRQENATARVSVNSAGGQANGPSRQPTLSDNGLSIAFTSDATNLTAWDFNLAPDVFLRNRQTGQTALLSPAEGKATSANGPSSEPRMSANGRYIAFTSAATNLVPGDSNGVADVFVRDRFNATTSRVPGASEQANADSAAVAISANGRYVLFNSLASNLDQQDTNGVRDAFLHDTWTFLTSRVSLGHASQQAGAACSGSALSGDGRCAIFNSLAGNLCPGDTNGKSDVFVRDLGAPD